MISYSEFKKGIEIVFQREPHKIIEADFMFKGRGHSILQAKVKNLLNGNIISKTFHPSDSFEEANISKLEAEFIYSHRGDYVFTEIGNPSKRFTLNESHIREQAKFLKPKQKVEGLIFRGKVVNVSLPIKIQLKIKEAPPGVKGGRAEAGTKQAILETGAKINVPLFIKEGDIIEINTETGEYVRRIEKKIIS